MYERITCDSKSVPGKIFFLELRDYRGNPLAEAIVCSYVAVIFLDLNVIMLKVGFSMINATAKLELY